MCRRQPDSQHRSPGWAAPVRSGGDTAAPTGRRSSGASSASWARYQLHTFLSLDLGGSGVEYLLTGSAIRESVGNQYFQHLLGYRARNLRIKVIRSGAA